MIYMAEIEFTLVPMDDNIIVSPDVEGSMSSGAHGLAIDLSAKKKEPPIRGTIVAVGEGKLLDSGLRQPMDLMKGERVFFSRYSGEEVETEGGKVVVMKRHEVLCVLRPKISEKGEDVEEE